MGGDSVGSQRSSRATQRDHCAEGIPEDLQYSPPWTHNLPPPATVPTIWWAARGPGCVGDVNLRHSFFDGS